MSRVMLGAAMGFMAGVGLMMTPMGRSIRKDMCKGMSKARQIMKDMEQGQ